MNRVQPVTQKHYRVKNPGQKPNWLHEPPTGPASAPEARRPSCIVAETRPYRGRGPGRVVACMAVSQAPSRSCCSAARAPQCSAPLRRVLAPQRPYRGRRRCVAARYAARQAAVSLAVSRYSPASCPLPTTIHLSVLRHTFQPSLATSVTIQILYCDTALIPAAILSCNTLSKLPALAGHNTMHCIVAQP